MPERCCSVAPWSRARVNVASGPAPTKETYTSVVTPAATAASTNVTCCATRSRLSPADTMSTVSTPARAARTASASPNAACATVAPGSDGARDGSRTTRR